MLLLVLIRYLKLIMKTDASDDNDIIKKLKENKHDIYDRYNSE